MDRRHPPLLFLNVLIVATCGLVYELLAGTLASYVLGDSVTQFSLIIGIYLSAMGVGSWLTGFMKGGLARKFLEVELGVALLGGFSAPLLFFAFGHVGWFRLILYGKVFLIGTLVGVELPLLMRILKDELDFPRLVSRVFTFDYLGALGASLLFPIFCVPQLGLVRTSLLFGIANAGVALWGTWLLGDVVAPAGPRRARTLAGLRGRAVLVMALLAVALVKADTLSALAEEQLFADEIVFARSSPYQRIVVTRGRAGFHLFLNGNLQFASADEYRYHEALVHPAMALAAEGGAPPRRVLVLGGGDGLAVREILKHPSVEHVTLVDLDPEMTRLARELAPLTELNGRALHDPRVEIVNADAMIWLEARAVRSPHDYHAVSIDFPDPNTYGLGKLYTTHFYRVLRASLAPEAAIAIQSTSPLFARRSFWCVVRTMEAAGLVVRPYHTAVPSFGVWGFALARATPFEPPAITPPGARFLDAEAMRAMFVIPADMGPMPVEVNRLDNQALVRYYEDEWRRYE